DRGNQRHRRSSGRRAGRRRRRLRARARASAAGRLCRPERGVRHGLRRLPHGGAPPRRGVARSRRDARHRPARDRHAQGDAAAGQGPGDELPARSLRRVPGPRRPRRARGEGARPRAAPGHRRAADLPLLPRPMGGRRLHGGDGRRPAPDPAPGRDVDGRGDLGLRAARLPRRRGAGV
ncbi:MAG: hypothetical protein AVDCRST_MAG38-2564, partial [uncultured Solirubrobacteraceae bacterium]